VTEEYVIADWMSRKLAPPKGVRIRHRQSFGGIEAPTRNLPRLKFGVHAVCAKCNNEWMKDLLMEASGHLEPMLDGQDVRLAKAAQVAIAKWAVLCAMVTEWKTFTRLTKYYTQAERTALADRGNHRLPDRTWVWTARHRGIRPGWVCTLDITFVADSPDNRKFPGYCATFVIQDLALQVLGCRPPGLGPTPNANWEAATVPVWPTTRWAGRWPPKQHIGDQSLKAFGEHWGEKNLPGKKGCPP